MDLHRAVGDAADHFAREVFGAGGFHGDVFAGVAFLRGVEDHAAGGVHFGLRVREHRLDQLELGDLLAELFALHRVFRGVADEALSHADADRADVDAAAVEHLHGDAEALALLAQ